ncbi:MAG: MGMT family protein [archaeon]|nr:MGMT family protein [archaeon]MDA0842787.1 MGMT family protein [archaeon]MDA1167769.1 MGMT family protein [archaeon]
MNDSLVNWCIDTPLAPLEIQVSNNGITKATFVKKFLQSGEVVSPSIEAHILSVKQWIEAYFMKKDLPMLEFDLASLTTFHRQVLRQLCKIQIGMTVSYSDLAHLCSRPKAARAVGSVMARNPIGLMIPCHRVVQKNGSIGAYSGLKGPKTKKLLLAFESQNSSFNEFMSR